MDIYLARGEEPAGPYPEEHVRQLMADGRLGGTELAWREGLEEWMNVKEMLDGAVPTAADEPALFKTARYSSLIVVKTAKARLVG